ncbi:MAG: GNAT family N-acetyltransferase [Candidatus Bathyarchaeia archaeon]
MTSNTPKIRYIHGDQQLLGDIALLWEGLNQHHLQLSKDFKQDYQQLTFEKRKTALLGKMKGGKMRVDIAVDDGSGQNVGYCVSSVSQCRMGEIESIFVAVNYRGLGVGDALLRKALAWLDAEGAETKVVEVGAGNEDAFGFYARYGFLPRKIVLKQVKLRE